NLDHQVLAAGAGAVGPGAALAAGRAEMLGVTKVDQRIEAGHRLKNHVAALATLTAVRTAIFDELFAPETDRAGPARAGADEDLGLVEEMHASRLARAGRFENLGACVVRFVKSNLAAARQRHRGGPPPAGAERLAALDALVGEPCDCRIQLVGHKIEVVDVVIFATMDAHLRRRKLVDQPPAAAVDAGNFEHIAKERPVGGFVLRKDHHMGAGDHDPTPYLPDAARRFGSAKRRPQSSARYRDRGRAPKRSVRREANPQAPAAPATRCCPARDDLRGRWTVASPGRESRRGSA